ncbi:hypothetical protein MKEN_00505800 [Mycena kentingensis (nom. inval.)]|nr:hypothetical protein MKEN_00505800 [Mycena kentingensis (nom. inval.)]
MRLLFSVLSLLLAVSPASASASPSSGSPTVAAVHPVTADVAKQVATYSAQHNVTVATTRMAYAINSGSAYGAPIPPWEPGAHPGWYFGRCGNCPSGLLCLVDDILGIVCNLLKLILGGYNICPVAAPTYPDPKPPYGGTGSGSGTVTPPPTFPPKLPGSYFYTYQNLTCAAEGCETYMTFGMVESIIDCVSMCDSVPGCIWANSYYDVNSSKSRAPNGDILLTCSLFNVLKTQADATNCGRQQQVAGQGLTDIQTSYGNVNMQFKFTTLIAAAVAASSVFTGASATLPLKSYSSSSISAGRKLTPENYYGAPIAPWKANYKPGWYYGHGVAPIGVIKLLDDLFCELLKLLGPGCYQCPGPKHTPPPPPPHRPPTPPPPPPPSYHQVQPAFTCATQTDDYYMTFGLVDAVSDCQAMCDSVPGCYFVNTYHDNNAANKGFSDRLTCSLFTTCQTNATAINCGGQGQPQNGGLNYITSSEGYCKY